MSLWQQLIAKFRFNERRRASRHRTENLGAYFWTGAAPTEHHVRDISSAGFYLVTEERWYPGTLLLVSLQKKNAPEDAADRAIQVQAESMRWGEDGVGLKLILPDLDDPRRGQTLFAYGADRKSFEAFLGGFQAETDTATVEKAQRAEE